MALADSKPKDFLIIDSGGFSIGAIYGAYLGYQEYKIRKDKVKGLMSEYENGRIKEKPTIFNIDDLLDRHF